MLNPLWMSIIFAILTGIMLSFAMLFYSVTQKSFRNIMGKQLSNSFFFTLVRIFGNLNFIIFFTLSVCGLITGFYMIKFSISSTGILVITPYIALFVTIIFLSRLVDNLAANLGNSHFKIYARPSISFEGAKVDEELRDIEKMFNAINDQLYLNLISPFGILDTYFATPGPKYPAAYLWDSAFINGAWRVWDERVAREIMMPFVDHQLDNGHCPQTVAFGLIVNKSIVNPPLVSWALNEVSKMNGDYNLFKEIFPKLKKFNEFMYKERFKQGLFAWKHSYESGIDNSPRFTDQSEKTKYDIEHLWAVDLNTWMVLQNDTLAKIADKLGLSEDKAIYEEKSQKLKDNINKYLWDEETGLYYDYFFKKQEFMKVPTIFSIFPMFSNIPTDEMARKLIRNIKDPQQFNTLVPFPTVSRNSDEFQKDCWRGAVWINTAYVGLKSLQNYNENNFAGDCAYRLVNAVAQTKKNEGSFYEFYDPDTYTLKELTRKKGNLFKQITLGGKPVKKFVGWTGLVNTILMEDIVGYKKVHGKTVIEPHLPENMKGITIRLTIPQHNEKLQLMMTDDGNISATIEIEDLNGKDIAKTTQRSISLSGKNNQILIEKTDLFE